MSEYELSPNSVMQGSSHAPGVAIAADEQRLITVWSEEDLILLLDFADRAGLTIANARLYEELEQRVQQRTAELSRTNMRLQQEIAEREQAEAAEREQDVLQLLVHGLSNSEIGKRLGISPHTVKNHLRSIYGKLKVSTRTAATRLALNYGLADRG